MRLASSSFGAIVMARYGENALDVIAVMDPSGALLFTGHFGCWEINAMAHGAALWPMGVLARDLDGALRTANETIVLFPDNAFAQYNVGWVSLERGDYETALKYYGVLATDPSFATMEGRVAWYYQYARLLKFHGRYDEETTEYGEASTDVSRLGLDGILYLRVANGRAPSQEQRNHALQYISHPDYPWRRLREEKVSQYESYADIGERGRHRGAGRGGR